jgi:ParB family chromosome partitioning protein
VQRGSIPLTTALEIARANENATEGDGQANLGDLLQEAYENGQLKGRQIIEAKRLIEKRLEHGPASPNRDQIKPPTSSYSLVAKCAFLRRWITTPTTPPGWMCEACRRC